MVRAILSDAMENVTFRRDPVMAFEVPTACAGVDPSLLDPRAQWADKAAYDKSYAALGEKFRKNFQQFRGMVSPEVAVAGP